MNKTISDNVLTFVILLGGMVVSLSRSSINSFFPIQANKLGIGKMSVGVIFACQPLGKIVFQNILKNVIYRRRRTSIIAGICISLISLFIFSFYENVKQSTLLFLLSMLCRFLLGIGECMFNIPAVTYLQEKNQQYNESGKSSSFFMRNLIGKMEAFLEMGNMIGPILGGTLFKEGGSYAVFMPICLIQMCLLISFIYSSRATDQSLRHSIQSTTTLPEVSQKNNDITIINNLSNTHSSKNKNSQSMIGEVPNLEEIDSTIQQKNKSNVNMSSNNSANTSINMLKIILTRNVFLNGVIIFLPLFSQSFIDPTLSVFLQDEFGMDEIEAGYFFFSNAFAFIITTSMLSQYYTKTVAKCRITTVFSLLSKSLAFFFFGPEKLFYISSQIPISVICSIIIGTSIGNIIVSQAKMLDYIISIEFPNYSKEQQIYLISILYNMFQDVGWLCGPLVGGVMTQYLSFPRASSIIGIIILSYTILYLVAFKLPQQKVNSLEQTNKIKCQQTSTFNVQSDVIIFPTFTNVIQINQKQHNNIQNNNNYKNENIIELQKQRESLIQIGQVQNQLKIKQNNSNVQSSCNITNREQGEISSSNLNNYSQREIDERSQLGIQKIQQQQSNDIKSFERQEGEEENDSPLQLMKRSSRIKRRYPTIRQLIYDTNTIQKNISSESSIQNIPNSDDFYQVFQIKPLRQSNQINQNYTNNIKATEIKRPQLDKSLIIQNSERLSIDEESMQDCLAERSTMCRLDGFSQSGYNPLSSLQHIKEESFFQSPKLKRNRRQQQSNVIRNQSEQKNLTLILTKSNQGSRNTSPKRKQQS